MDLSKLIDEVVFGADQGDAGAASELAIAASSASRIPTKLTELSDRDEAKFLKWYEKVSDATGVSSSPDHPAHLYDYRAAYKAGAAPDASGHMPSQFKDPIHPNRYVEGVDTITGVPYTDDAQRERRDLVVSLIDKVAGVESKADMNFASKALARGVDQFQGSLYGAAGIAGDLIGSDKIKEFGIEGYKRNVAEASQYPGTELKDIADSPWYMMPIKGGQWVLEKAIENVPNLGMSLATGGAGALVLGSGRVIGSKIVERSLAGILNKKVEGYVATGLIRKEAEKKAIQYVASRAGVVGATTAIESGGMYGEGAEKGVENPITSLAFGTANGFIELMGGNIRIIDSVLGQKTAGFFSKVVNRARKALGKGEMPAARDIGFIARTFLEAAEQAPAEFGQEAFQEGSAIANMAINDPTFDLTAYGVARRMAEAGLAGAAANAVTGGVLGVGSGRGKSDGTGTPLEAPKPETVVSLRTPEERQREIEKQLGGESILEKNRRKFEGEVADENRAFETLLGLKDRSKEAREANQKEIDKLKAQDRIAETMPPSVYRVEIDKLQQTAPVHKVKPFQDTDRPIVLKKPGYEAEKTTDDITGPAVPQDTALPLRPLTVEQRLKNLTGDRYDVKKPEPGEWRSPHTGKYDTYKATVPPDAAPDATSLEDEPVPSAPPDIVKTEATQVVPDTPVVEPTPDGPTVKTEMPKAKAKSLTPKEQKKYLLAEIDVAIEQAEAGYGEIPTYGEGKTKIDQADLESIGYVTIEVPGDGVFKIINRKTNLETFKKHARGFPASEISKMSGPRTASIKPTGKRISGEGVSYHNEFKQRKEGLLESPIMTDDTGKQIAGFYDGRLYSDGRYIVDVGKSKPVTKKTLVTDKKKVPDMKEFMSGDTIPAEIVGETYFDGFKEPGVHIRAGGKDLFYNAALFDSILTLHPKAMVAVKEDDGAAVFSDGKKRVGVVMPYQAGEDMAKTANSLYDMRMGKAADVPVEQTVTEPSGEEVPDRGAKIIAAIQEKPSGILASVEAELAASPDAPLTVPKGKRIALENYMEAEARNNTGALGGAVRQIGSGMIGESVYEIDRPYGTVVYDEATGNLSIKAESFVSGMARGLGVEKTLLLQTVSKDIVNNDLAGTIANETIQNALDAFLPGQDSREINITIEPAYVGGIDGVETRIVVEDNGSGMTEKQVRNKLLKLGAKGKAGTATIGGYGMAKAAFFLTPKRTKVTTIKDGVKTIVSGTKEQFFGVKGAGNYDITSEHVGPIKSGTTFEMNFFSSSEEAEKDNAFALSTWEARHAFEMYAKKGIIIDGIAVTIDGKRTVAAGPDAMDKAFPSQSVSVKGNKIEIHFVKADPPPMSWDKKYYPDIKTFNKGLALFALGGSNYRIDGLLKPPEWEVIVNFSVTPDVRSIDYPFIRNRTELNRDVAAEVKEIITKKIKEINKNSYEMEKTAFEEMVKNSPVIGGVRVLIPFIDKAEFARAEKLLSDNVEIVSGVSAVFKSFQKIIDKVGGKKLDLVMSVDPKYHGYRSNPEVTGHEFYAINPFGITRTFIANPLYKVLVDEQYDTSTAMASNLVHTLVHEYTHNFASEHYDNFTSKLAENYAKISHGLLARLEFQARDFYEKHGQNLGSLQDNFERMGTGGTRFSQNNLAVYAAGRQPSGSQSDQRTQAVGEERDRTGSAIASGDELPAKETVTRSEAAPLDAEKPRGSIRENFEVRNESRQAQRRVETPSLKNLKAENIVAAIKKMIKNWNNPPEFVVVQHQNELPQEIIDGLLQGRNKLIDGVYTGGKVYVVADNNPTMKYALSTIIHEVFGHHGLAIIKNDPALSKAYEEFEKRLYAAKQDEIDEISMNYGYDRYERHLAVEEWLASKINGEEKSSWVDMAVALVRRWIAKVFPKLNVSDTEIRVMLSQMRAAVETGASSAASDSIMRAERDSVDEFAQPKRLSLREAAKNVMENPAFRKWFGKSKVVDDDGNPLIVYHGQPKWDREQKYAETANITTFNTPTYFSESPDYAEQFGSKLYAVYLNISNPYTGSVQEIEQLHVNKKNLDRLIAAGYDGAIATGDVTGSKHKQYVVFSPTQIKSIYNMGTFDLKNPNIFYSQTASSNGMPLFYMRDQDASKSEQAIMGSIRPDNFNEKIKELPKVEVEHVAPKKQLGLINETLSLPSWLAKEFPAIERLFKAQLARMENRASMLFEKLKGIKKFLDFKNIELEQTRDIIWHLDQLDKSVTQTQRFKQIGEYDNGRQKYDLDEKHYDELKSYLKTKFAETPENVIDSIIDIRKSLDNDLLLVYDFLVNKKDVEPGTIDSFRQSMGQIKYYFPHHRYGKYALYARDEKGNVKYATKFDVPFYLTENAIQARANSMAGNLEAQMPDLKWEWKKELEQPEELYEYPIPTFAMDQIIDKAIEDSGLDDKAKEKFRGIFSEATADVLKSRGWGQHMMERKNIPGWETEDVQKVLVDYKSGLYGMLTKMDFAKDAADTLRTVKAFEEPRLYSFLVKYTKNMLENTRPIDKAVLNLKSVFFVKYLGGMLKAPIVNLSQNMTAGIPNLALHVKSADAAGYFFGTAGRNIASLAKAAFTGDVSQNTGLKDYQHRLLRELYAEGWTQDLFMQEVMGRIYRSKAGGLWDKVVWFMGWPMSSAERFNRASLALAAFEAAKDGGIVKDDTLKKFGFEKGKKYDPADEDSYQRMKEFAKMIVQDSHYVPGKANYPQAFRGGPVGKIASSAYTFRSFPHNFVLMWKNMLNERDDRGLKALGISISAQAALAGIAGLPLYALFTSLFRTQLGDDPEKELRELIPNGPEGSRDLWRDMVIYGIPSVTGTSLTSSMQIVLPGEEVFTGGGKDGWDVIGSIVGIPWAFLKDASISYDAMRAGRYKRMLEASPVTPIMIRNALVAARLSSEGNVSISGKPIVRPGEAEPRRYSETEAIKKSLGFPSVQAAKDYAIYNNLNELHDYKVTKQTTFANRYMNAVRSKDTKAMLAVLKELNEWNKSAVERGRIDLIINIKDAIAARQKGAQPPKLSMPLAQEMKKVY